MAGERLGLHRRVAGVLRSVVAGAAAGGLAGAAVSLDLDWTTTASRRECTGATGICIGAAPLGGLAIGLLASVVLCWTGLAIARLRPLTLFVPAAVALLAADCWQYLAHVPGGRFHPLWEFSVVAALSIALFALAGELLQSGRDRAVT